VSAVPVRIIAILALTAAFLPGLPYGYFVLLRWLICGVSVFLSVQCWKRGRTGWGITYLCMAGIFNPIEPVHLGRSVWGVVDIAAIGLIAYSFTSGRQADDGSANT